MANSTSRRLEPNVNVRIDVTNIHEVRKKILSLNVSDDAKSWLTIFANSLCTCTYEDENGNRYLLDKFSVLENLPCMNCTFKNLRLCSKYALQPNRFIRSSILLAKAIAWLNCSSKIEYEHVRNSVKYILP